MVAKEKLNELSYKNPIILFDGDCILCSKFVQWIIKYDSRKSIRFCALQNIKGNPYSENGDYTTVLFIKNGEVYEKSNVSIRVLKSLGGFWNLFLIIWIVPKFITDGIYDLLAKNRYKWFGKEKKCLVMTKDIEARMIVI